MHVVLGAGNLGIDLSIQLGSLGIPHEVLSRSSGFHITPIGAYECIESLRSMNNLEVIWYCVGGYSVESMAGDPVGGLFTQQTFPITLSEAFKGTTTRVIVFSSDYAASEKEPSHPCMTSEKIKSLYAYSKIVLEEYVKSLAGKGTIAVRVGSLYGCHKPLSCLPGKIMQHKAGDTFTLPTNRITPTPTDWLASVLSSSFKDMLSAGDPVWHLAPQGNVTVAEFGRIIMCDAVNIVDRVPDMNRPIGSNLGSVQFVGVNTSWKTLWKGREDYFKMSFVQAKMAEHERNTKKAT